MEPAARFDFRLVATTSRRAIVAFPAIAAATLAPIASAPLGAQTPVRSHSHGTGGMMAVMAEPPVLAPAAHVRLENDRDAGHLRLIVGPFDVPPMGADRSMQISPAEVVRMPVGAWLTSFRARLIDGDGEPLPQAMLHHTNVVLPDRRDLFTPAMQRLAAAGEETAPISLPFPLGVGVREGERLMTVVMVHNPTMRPVQGLTAILEIDYDEFGVLPRVNVQPMYLDVIPHGRRHAYDLPPGRSEKSWEGSPAIPGRIIELGGHLHRFGRELVFTDVTTGDTLWTSRPELGEDGDVAGMPQNAFILRLGIPIRPDHVYRLTAVYDNTSGHAVPDGAMGAMGGLFKPAPGTEWPTVDPGSEKYRED